MKDTGFIPVNQVLEGILGAQRKDFPDLTPGEEKRFRTLVRDQLRQGPTTDRRIQRLYAIIREEAHSEFYEDNMPTLDEFLKEQFDKTLGEPW